MAGAVTQVNDERRGSLERDVVANQAAFSIAVMSSSGLGR